MDQRIETLIKLLTEAAGSNQELQKLQDQYRAATEKARTIDDVMKLLKPYADNFGSFVKNQNERLAEAVKLAELLGKESPPSTKAVRPTDIARQFRALIDDSQREARIPREGETAATLKSLDVELKGLIVVEKDEAGIVPPRPDSPIDAGQLSTIRMSFGSIPVLKTLQQQPPEKPK